MHRVPSPVRLHSVRAGLLLALVALVSAFAGAGSAQAVVVNMHDVQPGVVHTDAYNASDLSGLYGVDLTKDIGMRTNVSAAGIPIVTDAASCTDPLLAGDLGGPFLPATGLCAHPSGGPMAPGSVMHSNRTFTLTWDPGRRYWQSTANYVQQFLRDVADASHTLTSPYAVTPQYTDQGGAAQNASSFGGGCTDLGVTGGSACKFGSTDASGQGHDYSPSGPSCAPTGTNQWAEGADGSWGAGVPNAVCLTDAQIRQEVSAEVAAQGILTHADGSTPLVVVLTPPGVVDCLDAGNRLCSANADPRNNAALFCSYHAQVPVTVGGTTTQVDYVVQPWVAGGLVPSGCDDTGGVDPFPTTPTASQLSMLVGERLVGPLSQSHIAAITDPGFTGWFANDGSEVNDNGCVALGGVDVATVGKRQYVLPHEFSNDGAIHSDPNSLICAGSVDLQPAFVAPSAARAGDVLAFDGSTTVSTFTVPTRGYHWNFGDGSQDSYGASVEHSYGTPGWYTVTLTVTDRVGDVATTTGTVEVLRADGTPPPVPTPTGTGTGTGTGTPAPGTNGAATTPAPTPASGPGARPVLVPVGPGALSVRVQMLPQSLRSLLASGMAVRVASNQAADGIITMSITRAAARQAHIRPSSGVDVVIGRGTVAGKITSGAVVLRLRLTAATAAKLRRVKHLRVTVRLELVGARGQHETLDAAGQF